MDIHYLIAHVLSIVFIIGIAGCVIAIPIVAVKFAMVLFEKDPDESPEEAGGEAPVERSGPGE